MISSSNLSKKTYTYLATSLPVPYFAVSVVKVTWMTGRGVTGPGLGGISSISPLVLSHAHPHM